MKLSLVVPVFNEEQAVGLFYQAVRQEPSLQPYCVEIVFVNDGSTDRTADYAAAIALADTDVLLINFSRNFGKEAALFAGLEYAGGEAVVPMDVDLQDPVAVISRLVEPWLKGADVVLAKRRDRSSDSYVKRYTASMFYHLLNRIASPHIEENVGDFRLLDRRVVDVIKTLPEQQLFMKGVLSWAGFNVAIVTYDRAPRAAGRSKFDLWKLWNLALEGITSFSTLPLRLWSYVGAVVALIGLFQGGWQVLGELFFEGITPGHSRLMAVGLFLGGVQLVGIGVLGEYVGRIYMEIKHRPRYIIKDIIMQK
jgi:glycosyltransferase involved in cell wall biosynthesis